MTCDEFDELLLFFVEDSLENGQAATVRAHVDGCDGCRRKVAQTRELVEALSVARSLPAVVTQSGAAMPAVWPTGTRLGDFEILDELGRGGMGVVYRARQVSLNRTVALKALPAGLGHTPRAVARFRVEAQAAAKLHHTNIVAVYAQGEHLGHFYYAMELIEGQSLDRVLRDQRSALFSGAIPAAEASESGLDPRSSVSGTPRRVGGYGRLARLFAEVADALDHAHRQGVIHRDIKPQNLVLGVDGRLHITDFGLARLLDEPSVTVSGEMVGTPAYMSPEQVGADRRAISHRTDVYSLGVTLYEVLTGNRPFAATARDQVLYQICTLDPIPPRKVDPHVPLDLETICLRAMEKEPRRRYASAGDLAADLRRFAENVPIVSRRAGPLERAWKWARRHPTAAAVCSFSTLLVMVAAAWGVQTVRARHARAADLVERAFEHLAYVDYRRVEEPLRMLEEAGRLGRQTPRWRMTRALTLIRENAEEAVPLLESVVAEQPDNKEALYLLAWAYRANAQYDAEFETLRRGDSAGGPESAAALFFRGLAVIVQFPQQAAENFRAANEIRLGYTQAQLQRGRAWNYRAYRHRTDEGFEDQVAILKTACETGGAYPRYLLSLAYRYAAEIAASRADAAAAAQRREQALFYARGAQQREPTVHLGYAAEAEYWESVGEYSRAVAVYDGAEPIYGENRDVELLEYRWRVCYWSGAYDRALADLARLAKAMPDHNLKKPWFVGLFPALVRADRGEGSAAVDLARRMAARFPTSPRAITSAACLLRLLKRAEEAGRLLEQHRGTVRFDERLQPPLTREWMEWTYRYCQGRAGWGDLVRVAGDRGGDKWLWANAEFIAAADALAAGRRAEALGHLRRCRDAYDYEDYCYLATVFVRRMEADEKWPSWDGG